MDESIKYKRVLLKLSGEALGKDGKGILNYDILKNISAKIKTCINMGVSFAIVVGAGNIWRGSFGKSMDGVRADHMGMIATVINALALQDVLESDAIETRVMTAIEMNQVAEPYIRNKALSHLKKGRVCIFAGGTGSPYFTTDTAAVMRAKEINADIVLLGKNNADGVYSADPNKFPDAKMFDNLNYQHILIDKNLGVMDNTAASYSMDNNIPILVIGIDDTENIIRALKGEKIGTMIKN
ncbi:MAG: UMP kinase [Oscillospiraceae bacterium]|nr:UMP kinase [Oscillospiraceae bacterium]